MSRFWLTPCNFLTFFGQDRLRRVLGTPLTDLYRSGCSGQWFGVWRSSVVNVTDVTFVVEDLDTSSWYDPLVRHINVSQSKRCLPVLVWSPLPSELLASVLDSRRSYPSRRLWLSLYLRFPRLLPGTRHGVGNSTQSKERFRDRDVVVVEVLVSLAKETEDSLPFTVVLYNPKTVLPWRLFTMGHRTGMWLKDRRDPFFHSTLSDGRHTTISRRILMTYYFVLSLYLVTPLLLTLSILHNSRRRNGSLHCL